MKIVKYQMGILYVYTYIFICCLNFIFEIFKKKNIVTITICTSFMVDRM